MHPRRFVTRRPPEATAYAAEMLWVPRALVPVSVLRSFIVFPIVKDYGPTQTDDPDSDPRDPARPIDPVVTRRGRDGQEWVGLPLCGGLQWAERRLPPVKVIDYTCEGEELHARKTPDPHHPNAGAGQAEFMAALFQAVTSYYTVLAEAQTGFGKSVCILWLAAKLGRATLVVVTSRTLANQWELEAMTHLGLLKEEIGIVQEGNFPFEGKQLVIAVINNLIDRPLPQGFARHFGFCVMDEGHRQGAREFSRAMPLIPARYKMTVTATAYRKDGCMPLITNHYGEVAVNAGTDYAETNCVTIYSEFTAPEDLQESGRLSLLLKYLSGHAGRNQIIRDAIISLWRQGRRFLVISDRVKHLQILQRLVLKHGIPEGETDFYTGYVYTDDKWTKKRSVKEDHLRQVRESRSLRIIFGSYAKMKEGVNIPWLDAGIDAMPQADGVQTIGRIRRKLHGKKTPVWVTVVDCNIPILKAFANRRLAGYGERGVTIYDQD